MDCGSQVFGEADFFIFRGKHWFSRFLRSGTFVAKMIATSYRCNNKRQLPPNGRDCLYSGLFLFLTKVFIRSLRVLRVKPFPSRLTFSRSPFFSHSSRPYYRYSIL
jgi:hypothetical protein